MKAIKFLAAFLILAPFNIVGAFVVAAIFCSLKNEWDDIL